METAGIVLLSIFGGAIFIVIIGALATLIVLHIRLKKSQNETEKAFRRAVDEINALVVKLSGDVDASISGARTSFSGIRSDIKTALDAHANQVGDTLAKHDKAFQDKLGKINGTALEAACVRAVQAANSIVQVASFLRKMIAEGGEPSTASNLAPEEYGPAETVYSQQSRTAELDDSVFEIEGADVMSDAAPAE